MNCKNCMRMSCEKRYTEKNDAGSQNCEKCLPDEYESKNIKMKVVFYGRSFGITMLRILEEK